MKSEKDIDEAMEALERYQGPNKQSRDLAASALNWVLGEHGTVEHLFWELGLGPQPDN